MPNCRMIMETIRYEEKGTGEPLILIHGVGLDHAMWEQQVNSLSKHYRVIVYDMLGHGGSAHPPGPYSLSQFVEQLATLMNELKIDKSHICWFFYGWHGCTSFCLSTPRQSENADNHECSRQSYERTDDKQY